VTGEQLDGLRPIASYDTETQTWHARLGALDLAGVQMLQALSTPHASTAPRCA
jgi:hypothetical protein